jgi:hypothetical protein
MTVLEIPDVNLTAKGILENPFDLSSSASVLWYEATLLSWARSVKIFTVWTACIPHIPPHKTDFSPEKVPTNHSAA